MLYACAVCGASATALAQPNSQPGPPATTEAPADPIFTGDVIYLKDENGKPVPVLMNTTQRQFLEWLEKNGKPGALAETQYSISSISMTGRADDQWAAFDVVASIHVNEDNRFVKVPLMLGEGNLGEIHYVGEGDYSFAGHDAKSGYQWWLKGKGDHQLHLKLTVPVRKQVQTRRLLLTLPPRAGSSTVHLSVDTPQASFKFPEGSSPLPLPEGTTIPAGSSVASLSLRGTFDLAWQPTPEKLTERTILQSTTRIELSFTSDSILLKATQQITAAQGNFRDVALRLPTGFDQQNLKVSGGQAERLEAIANRPQWYQLTLMQPTSGPIDLEWVFERPLPAAGETFRLEGFEIEGDSPQQSGDVTLSSLSGHRLREHQRRAVFRRRVSSTEAQRDIQRAYEFYRQPFALDLELQKITPTYSVAPEAALRISRDQMVLDAEFRVTVHRGSLDGLTLDWPEWSAQGWKIEPSADPELVESIETNPDDPSRLGVRFVEPRSASFAFTLRATRAISEMPEPMSIRIPMIPGGVSTPIVPVRILGKLNLDVDVSPRTPPRDTPQPGPELVDAEEFRTLKQYRFAGSAPIELVATVTPRAQSVAVSTDVSITPFGDEAGLRVDQLIRYDVRYEPLSTLRFRASAEALKSISAFDERGEKLDIEEIPSTLGSLRQFRVDLPQARLGTFSLRFSSIWKQPVAGNGAADAAAPGPALIQSVDAEFSAIQLRFQKSSGEYLRVSETAWKRQPVFDPELTEYLFLGSTLPLQLELRQVGSSEGRTSWNIVKCWLTSSTDGDGTIRTRAVYRLEGSFPSIDVELPEGYQLGQIEIGGQKQSLPANADPGSLRLSVPIPASLRGTRQVVLELVLLRQNGNRLGWSSDIRFEAPRFPNARVIGDTYWTTVLPYKQHLLTPPFRYTPQFEWTRDNLIWSRKPLVDSAQLSSWIGHSPEREEAAMADSGNTYLFHTFAEPRELSYRTMNRPMVILLGAGLVLIVSFLLLKLPATKNALTFLTLALALAVSGVWYPTSVALLLQPAILGFLLAVSASLFDRMFRGPARPTIITLDEMRSPESAYGSSLPVATPELPAPMGSEEPTELRTRPVPAQESLSSSLGGGGE